ncbi:MAG: hypothetical protein ABSH08_19815 [Tepidisphaeraceae bacterium]|jgi:hypothetical protein
MSGMMNCQHDRRVAVAGKGRATSPRAGGGRFGGEVGGLSRGHARTWRAVNLGPAGDCAGHPKSALKRLENGLFGNKNQQKSTKIATVFDQLVLIPNELKAKFR